MEVVIDPDALETTPTVAALDARLRGPGGAPALIEAQTLASLRRELALSEHEAVIAGLRWAKRWARPPTSRFKVGAVALGASGRLYLGANIEFSGLPLNETVHAEQAAIVHAWIHGEPSLRALAASAAPCGYCRQFMFELPEPRPMILIPGHPAASLDELLPQHFGPEQLDREPTFLIAGTRLSASEQGLALSQTDADADALTRLALEAAAHASVPYSGFYAGVALALADGRRFRGSAAESAAYNPTLGPMQAALIALHLGGGRFEDIADAALVELEDPLAPYQAATERLLARVAPGVALRHATCVRR
ncbi:cytidine deaminase [Pseudenhygromyxa sp. WMMC2535]|uniref:cytidine deaminase n=1 Tax=Pseudenhygromyxa sp. WMMC2535 TaxID=2712867 RepID=UPI001552DF18|nr:cytidine deaminase [Pseudenhygromyxa sp. WMMC2535]NVB43019.1 cytidine deaminase [Pseudenhygromyxa sp. WMMC2535]